MAKAVSALIVTGFADRSSATVGSKETVTAVASGGSGSYTYSILMRNKDTNAWYRFSDFKSSNSITWTASTAGNREFYVEVKDRTGKVARNSAVSVVVK